MTLYKNIKLEFLIAFKYLQSRNKEKFISVNSIFSLVGIALGVAALIVVMSIMNGFHEELSSKIIGLNSDVIINNYVGAPITDSQKKIEKIKKLQEVQNSFASIQKQGLVTHQGKASGIVVKAIEKDALKYQTLISKNIPEEVSDNFNGFQIILGISVANKLRVVKGQKVTLMSPEFHTNILGKLPRMKDFTVTGIFHTGLTEYDEGAVIVPLDSGQIFYDMQDKVNQIEVFAYDHSQAPKLAGLINQLLDDQYIVTDWQRINAALFNALKAERVAMFTILTLIIIVAAFSIVSSLTMLVMDKNKEIAVLKTLGMQNISIIRIFFICGFIISIIASGIGLAIGLAISYNIQEIKEFLSTITHTNLFDPVVYYLDSLPSKVDINDIKLIGLIVTLLTALATFYPARKAGNLNPVDILKSE